MILCRRDNIRVKCVHMFSLVYTNVYMYIGLFQINLLFLWPITHIPVGVHWCLHEYWIISNSFVLSVAVLGLCVKPLSTLIDCN